MAFLAICVLLDSRLPPMPSSLITYLAQRASKVIPGNSHSGPHTTEEVSRTQFPPINVFIDSVVRRSGASVPTLLTSLVYLWRLQQRLPTDGKCLPSTPHRIFLAALIVATKSLHDASPWNRHWCQYTVVSSYGYFGFTVPEVNLMEREFLYLLDWDIRIHLQDLHHQLESWLAFYYSLRPRDLEPRLKTEYQHLVTKLQYESRDGRVERQAQSQDRTTSGCNTIRSTTSTVQRS
jgi:G1/S-specific cyclin PLC1